MQTQSIDTQKLKDIYTSNQNARPVFDLLAKRERASKATTVDALMRGTDFSRAQMVELLKTLSDAGVGEFKAGRRGFHSRMEWNCNLADVGRVASGSASEIHPLYVVEDEREETPAEEHERKRMEAEDAAKPLESNRPVKHRGRPKGSKNKPKVAPAGLSKGIGHQFVLRPGYKVNFALPEDVTAQEVKRISDFLQTIPFAV